MGKSKSEEGQVVQEASTLGAIVAFIFCYSLLIILLPLYIFRQIVSLLARLFRPELSHMLHTRSVFFAGEYPNMYIQKPGTRCAILVTKVLDGQLDISTLRTNFLKKVVQLKDKSGQLVNPELMQKISSWFGYLFWEWDKDFRIENHIKLYEGPGKSNNVVFEQDIPKLMKELTHKPFTPGQSPWEFWIWNNVQTRGAEFKEGGKSVVIFRVHHCLADGISILKLLVEELEGKKLSTIIPHPRKGKSLSFFQKIFAFLRLIAKAPYDVIKLGNVKSDDCVWTITSEQATGRINSAVTNLIPVNHVKDIKNKFGGSLNTALLAAYAGGIRNFMEERGLQIPHKFYCTTALPMPNHPMKLRNHMAGVTFRLPVGIKGSKERLLSVINTFEMLGSSTEPLTFFYMAALTCALPHWIVKKFFAFSAGSCLMSNFPGPDRQMELAGVEVEDLRVGSGYVCSNVGLGAGSFSYKGGIRLTVGIDEGIFTDPQEVKDLVKKIEEEIYILRG